MILVRSLHEIGESVRGGAVAVGNFDGVHRGHARIAQALVEEARRVGGPATAFTFEPHPVRVLRPEHAPPPLTWTERKAELLERLGLDVLVACPTDAHLLQLTAEAFFEQILCGRLAARAIVEGPNFRFGRGREGNIERLAALCRAAGVRLSVVPPLVDGDQYVSSSRIRRLIGRGDVAAATRLLTEPYRIRGMVTHGSGRGASIGYPTANVEAVDTLLPAPGVYAGRAWTDGRAWPAAINIGPNPTFGERLLKVEVHLVGFHGQLYGQPLEVDFLDRLRNIQPFPSVAALRDQLARDVARARTIARAVPAR